MDLEPSKTDPCSPLFTILIPVNELDPLGDKEGAQPAARSLPTTRLSLSAFPTPDQSPRAWRIRSRFFPCPCYHGYETAHTGPDQVPTVISPRWDRTLATGDD